MSMWKSRILVLWLFVFFDAQLRFSAADIGIATQYLPPYTPSACYGGDLSKFPASNLFAAAGEGIWDNGAACGRQYRVRCINGVAPWACVPGQAIIQVMIVDRARTSVSRPAREGATLVLSNTAFQKIANPAIRQLNIELQQI